MASAGLILLIRKDGTALPMMAMKRAAPTPTASVLPPTDVVMLLSVWLLVRPKPRNPGPPAGKALLVVAPPGAAPGPPPKLWVVCDEVLFETSVFVTGLAAAMPMSVPTTRPRMVKVNDSTTNCAIIFTFDAPMAFITPISRRLSRTIIIMVSNMMTAPAWTSRISQPGRRRTSASHRRAMLRICTAPSKR